MKTKLATFAGLSYLFLLFGCNNVPPDRAATEYRVDRVEFKFDPATGLQDHLNTMSKDGWRLVQFVEHDNWYRVVMSRPMR